jgi:hypothetical protein
MKLNTLFLTLAALPVSLFAQGSLTPSGAPAPTMKTLDQIEPRTAISATTTPGNFLAQYIISKPGSYYLTNNIVGVDSKRGIEVDVGNVTIDLNGFSMFGVSNSYDAIYCAYSTNDSVIVRNGTIMGWGGPGITHVGNAGLFEQLSLVANLRGITCGSASIVRGCTMVSNFQSGLHTSGSGNLIAGNVFAGNNVQNNGSYGGITIFGARNRIEGNHVTSNTTNGYGINFGGTTNIVIQNTVMGSGANNYSSSFGHVVGPIITGGGFITNSNPWANFSY